jgi:hypothetical protein
VSGTAEDIAVEEDNKEKKLVDPDEELAALRKKVTELEQQKSMKDQRATSIKRIVNSLEWQFIWEECNEYFKGDEAAFALALVPHLSAEPPVFDMTSSPSELSSSPPTSSPTSSPTSQSPQPHGIHFLLN